MGKRTESEHERVLGLSSCLRGELDQALFHYRRAVETDPSYDLAAFQLGLVYLGLGDFDSAIAMLCKTIKPYEDCAEAYYYLGMAYYMKGEYDKASVHFNKAIAQRPQYFDLPRIHRIDPYGLPNAYYWRGRARKLVEKSDAKDSLMAGNLDCGSDEADSELIGDVRGLGESAQAQSKVQRLLFPDS